MVRRPLFCEACGCATEHQIEESDEDGEILALCTRCGRLQTLPQEAAKPPPAKPASQPEDSRTR